MEDKIHKKNYLYTVLNISLQIIIAGVIYFFDDNSAAGQGGYPQKTTYLWWLCSLLFWGNLATFIHSWKYQETIKLKSLSFVIMILSVVPAVIINWLYVIPILYQVKYMNPKMSYKRMAANVITFSFLILLINVAFGFGSDENKNSPVYSEQMSYDDSLFVVQIIQRVMSEDVEIGIDAKTRFQDLLKKYPKQLEKPDLNEALKVQIAFYKDAKKSIELKQVYESKERKVLEKDGENVRNNEYIKKMISGEPLTGPNGEQYLITIEYIDGLLTQLESTFITRQTKIDALYSLK